MTENKISSLWNWFKSSDDTKCTTLNSLPLSIDLEKQIGEQIYNALQGMGVMNTNKNEMKMCFAK